MQSTPRIYKHPFSMNYWKDAASEFSKTKTIALAAIFIAMTIVLETIGNLFPYTFLDRKVMFAFIPVAISAMLFGPLVGLTTGFIADILGFFVSSAIAPMTFFPGYTISAMLSAFIYSLFLYRTNISLFKIISAKFIVNFFVNAFLGAIWLTIMYGKKTFWLYFSGGLIKNLVLLPLEVLILLYLLQRLIPISKSFGLLDYNINDNINII